MNKERLSETLAASADALLSEKDANDSLVSISNVYAFTQRSSSIFLLPGYYVMLRRSAMKNK